MYHTSESVLKVKLKCTCDKILWKLLLKTWVIFKYTPTSEKELKGSCQLVSAFQIIPRCVSFFLSESKENCGEGSWLWKEGKVLRTDVLTGTYMNSQWPTLHKVESSSYHSLSSIHPSQTVSKQDSVPVDQPIQIKPMCYLKWKWKNELSFTPIHQVIFKHTCCIKQFAWFGQY